MTTNELITKFLRWLHRTADPRVFVNPEDFLNDPAEFDGAAPSEQDLVHAIERAERYDLIKAERGLGGPLPHSVRLQPAGRECVDEYEGDSRRYVDAQRGTSTNTMTVHQGVGGNVSGFNTGDTTQSNRIEVVNSPEHIRAGADAVEELLRLYPGTQNRAEIEGAVEDARKAASDGDDEARASASSRLVTAITTMSGVSTLARFVIDWLGGPGALG